MKKKKTFSSKSNLLIERQTPFFAFGTIFKIKTAIRAEGIGLDSFYTRNWVISNMEKTRGRPFSAFTISLINTLCFNIDRCLYESRFGTFLFVFDFVHDAKFYHIADGERETVSLLSETHGKSNESLSDNNGGRKNN